MAIHADPEEVLVAADYDNARSFGRSHRVDTGVSCRALHLYDLLIQFYRPGIRGPGSADFLDRLGSLFT